MVGKEILSVSTIHSALAYIVSSLCVSLIYLRNVSEQANLSTTVTRFKLFPTMLISRGYELPRLNERLVYLIYFSIFTSTAFSLFQRAIHRTLLPYRSVMVKCSESSFCWYLLRHTYGQSLYMRLGSEWWSRASSHCHLHFLRRFSIWLLDPQSGNMLCDLPEHLSSKPPQVFHCLKARMPRSSTLPDFPASLGLFFRSMWLAFVMTSMWEAANLFFDAFITKV